MSAEKNRFVPCITENLNSTGKWEIRTVQRTIREGQVRWSNDPGPLLSGRVVRRTALSCGYSGPKTAMYRTFKITTLKL